MPGSEQPCLAQSSHAAATPQVNNAGVALPHWSSEHWSANVATNAAGPVLLTRALLPAMKGGGTVVMVSSGGGLPGWWWPAWVVVACLGGGGLPGCTGRPLKEIGLGRPLMTCHARSPFLTLTKWDRTAPVSFFFFFFSI